MTATSYLFHKAYGQYGEYECHFYCSGCTNYIGKVNGQFIHEVKESNTIYAVHTQSFKRKCVMIELKEKMYFIALPNNIESD